MILVDIGNTKTTFCCCFGREIENVSSAPTRSLSQGPVEAFLAEALELDSFAEVWVASVVPGCVEAVNKACAARGAAVHVVRPGEVEILPHRLRTPDTTGVDRLLAARAAWAAWEGRALAAPVVVVQAGTALTVDAVDRAGVFAGGWILPGPGMWLQSLTQAAQLPAFLPDEMEWDDCEPGQSTREAILHGAVVGLSGAAQGAIARWKTYLAAPECGVVVTGGWGRELASCLAGDVRYEPHLVLRGLASVATVRGKA